MFGGLSPNFGEKRLEVGVILEWARDMSPYPNCPRNVHFHRFFATLRPQAAVLYRHAKEY